MNMRHCVTKYFKSIFTLVLFTMSLFAFNAHAQIIDTETLTHKTQVEQDRNYIHDALSREEVKNKLQELGVNPEEIQARVDSLTDSEVHLLATDINSLPAGGRTDTVVVLLLIIVIILLI